MIFVYDNKTVPVQLEYNDNDESESFDSNKFAYTRRDHLRRVYDDCISYICLYIVMETIQWSNLIKMKLNRVNMIN